MAEKPLKGQEVFDKILSDHRELTSLPQVLNEVLKVSGDPRSSASDLARVIVKDPPLTARLLRVVNSPFFAPGREITTVQDAVVTLGTRSVTALALSASIYDTLNKVNSPINRKRFWRHSLEVAIASRMIAQKIGYKPTEEAFVTGLLHDIGTLVLEASFPDEFRRIWKLVEAGENQIAAEQRTWSTDHARTGQFLLDQWGLPRRVGEAVKRHHETYQPAGEEPGAPGPSPEAQLGLIVNLANQISRFRTYNTPPPEAKSLENRDLVASALGLSQADINHLAESLVSEVVQESGYLEIDIGNMEEILHEANRILVRQYLASEDLLRENRTIKQQLGRDQVKKAALESLKTLAATFGYYLGSVADTIREKAVAIEASTARGDVVDRSGAAALAVHRILNAVEAMESILAELKNLTTFESTVFQDSDRLAEIEQTLKSRLENIEKIDVPA